MIKGSFVCVLLAVAGQLSACHGESGDAPLTAAPQIHAPAPLKRGPSPEELTAGMVEAVTVGKSTVPVLVKFDLPVRPVVGQPVEVVVAVMPQMAADDASLVVGGGEGMTFVDTGPVDMPSVEPSQVYRHNIQITPTADGLRLLSLSVSLKHDDMTETRTFSVPLVVATSGPPAADAVTSTATGPGAAAPGTDPGARPGTDAGAKPGVRPGPAPKN